MLGQAEAAPGQVLAAVVGIPGPLDREHQVVISPTILGTWIDLAPAAELGSRPSAEGG
jgi:hypothetical protein